MSLGLKRSEFRSRTKAAVGGALPSLPPTATEGRRLLVGFGIVALVATGHAVHDLSHGIALWLSVSTGALIVGQCATLTIGHRLAHRWNVSRWSARVTGALISATFGLLILVPHAAICDFSWVAIAVAGVLVGFGISGLWTLVFQLPAFVDRARLRALEVENLRREAELSRLRVHLHPHFLINTLNAIAGLVTEDAAEARRLLAALGDLVRDALLEGDELRPFGVEVAWLRRYAEILEARHRGFLSFHWTLAEETLGALVPRLLLQPLIENAIKHGALRQREGGSVLLHSEMLERGTVRFVIEDDGPGLGANPVEGLGISLVRRRLALMCPGGSVRFMPTDAGTRVVVEIPKPAEGYT